MARSFVSASSQLINCGNMTSLNGLSTATMTFWSKRASAKTAHIGRGSGSTNVFEVLHNSDNIIYALICSGSTSYGYVAETGAGWLHHALVFDGGFPTNPGRMKLYTNGLPRGLAFSGNIPSTLPTNTTDLIIGKRNWVGAFSDGNIAEVRIYSSALTQNEIYSDYRGLIVKSLLGYWKLGVSSPEPDWSGNGWAGSLTNAPAIVDNPPVRPPYSFNVMPGMYTSTAIPSGTIIPKIMNQYRMRRAA